MKQQNDKLSKKTYSKKSCNFLSIIGLIKERVKL